MAGNKINTKNKGREDRGKTNKGVNQTNEEVENLDFALLRKPIHTSITGFAQARKIFDFATEEVKNLLSNDCDLLYECKVCRNIFRSLANFISHKRVYCKEKFNSSIHSHFIKTASTVEELLKIKHTEEGYQESLKNGNDSTEVDENDDRIPLSKDLTAIIEKITKNKGIHEINKGEQQVTLQKIPSSNVAVYQNVNNQEDTMSAEINELDNIISKDKAVLQSDGKFLVESSKPTQRRKEGHDDTDNVIQISDDDDTEHGDGLKCKICDLQFSTQKTLKFHMKYKHLESRLVYPCPDCLEIFSTSWSVYRHLFKVHRKTAAQIRRLRESIQSKAFRMNNPPAFYEKRKNNMKPVVPQKITEDERLDQENQAWMDNMEGDGEVPRCGGCGRTFERRAALAAHTHTCQPRSRALARRPEAKKIEIQIRKDYNKGPVTGLTILNYDSNHINDNKVPTIETQAVSKIQKDTEKVTEDIDKDLEDEAPMDIVDDEQKSNDSSESAEKTMEAHDDIRPAMMLPFSIQAEKSNLAAFKQRIHAQIDLNQVLCKKCSVKFNTILQLYEHVAEHYKWMRYACKLCNFKHYNFDKLPEHIKVVHKLKGDSDFYFSTMKAIDGTEAMIISRCLVESESTDDANEISPESRRPSRCSSDSSRLSDDSSSSSTLKEGGSRKRKMYQIKNISKRKKEPTQNDECDDKNADVSVEKTMKSVGERESVPNFKGFEENSSDIEDVEDKIPKNFTVKSMAATSRRPVRKRTKPKNEDFEYDLSNLLKMEAQGYRDSQSTVTTKTTQNKKKLPQDNNYDNMNKDCCGALATLSKKAVDNSKAHMKTALALTHMNQQKDQRPSSTFARPMLPKIVARSEKMSPKKDINDDPSPSKLTKPIESTLSQNKDDKKECDEVNHIDKDEVKTADKDISQTANIAKNSNANSSSSTKVSSENNLTEKIKANINNIPAVVPIKFRRQSLDVIKKNPIINRNITDFTKAGMKTKILVIKPINRNKDGTAVNAPLKFQTIKLKDANKRHSTNEDKPSDQVVVVKVPKVDPKIGISQSVTNVTTSNTETTTSSTNNAEVITNENKKKEENEKIENKTNEIETANENKTGVACKENNELCIGNEIETTATSKSVTETDKTIVTNVTELAT